MKPLDLDDSLLKLLYGGPLEPMPWRGFLEALIEHVGCENAAITLQLGRSGVTPLLIWARDPQVEGEAARAIGDRHADLAHKDLMRHAMERSGDIVLLEDVTDPDTLEDDEFYQTVLKPYGIVHALGMHVREPGGLECNIGLTSSLEVSPFTRLHKDFMARLRPHFAQALELFARIHRDESEIEVLTDALDRLTIATFMIDARGRLVRSNGAAKKLVGTEQPFLVRDRRLSLSGRADAKRFAQVIDEALEARFSPATHDYVRAFRCTEDGREELGVLVRAIPRERGMPADLGPAVVIYATEAGRTGSFKQLIATLFDLSPSEANLAALLTEGLTLAEAAREAGLTESTVRSYSKRIFAKLGVSRQTDLVRLILRSVAMLG